jgi:hypothetical protein
MDLVSLVGDKIFSSLYDPKADGIAAQFRKNVSQNLGGLENVISKATESKDLLNNIPGVSGSTKESLEVLIKQSNDFLKGASKLTPNEIAAKKDEINMQIKELIGKAKGESREKKKEAEKKKQEELKEKVENQTFSISRLLGRTLDSAKFYILYIGLFVLALWGGSISSNANINKPVLLRAYYFLYGAILFPVSFAFAIWRYTTGNTTPYYALLAPLIERPVQNQAVAMLLWPFVYTSPTQVATLPVTPTGLTGTSV